jgi:hypothetical protein
LKRIFHIRKKNSIIDLSNSCCIKKGKLLKSLFQTEIYTITFSSINTPIKEFSFYLHCNQAIDELDIAILKERLGIEIAGDGSYFEILSYENEFAIQFDQENSSFIDSEEVKNGLVIFKSK